MFGVDVGREFAKNFGFLTVLAEGLHRDNGAGCFDILRRSGTKDPLAPVLNGFRWSFSRGLWKYKSYG